MLTQTNQYAPTEYDLEPARISKIASDNLSECLEHQARVEQYAAAYTAINEVEAGLQSDREYLRQLRQSLGDYRIDDTVIDRRSGVVCKIVGIVDDRFRCLIIDHRGNQLLAHTRLIYLYPADIA